MSNFFNTRFLGAVGAGIVLGTLFFLLGSGLAPKALKVEEAGRTTVFETITREETRLRMCIRDNVRESCADLKAGVGRNTTVDRLLAGDDTDTLKPGHEYTLVMYGVKAYFGNDKAGLPIHAVKALTTLEVDAEAGSTRKDAREAVYAAMDKMDKEAADISLL